MKAVWIEIQSIFSIFLASNTERRNRAVYGYILGFISTVIINMGFFSINAPFHYPISNAVALGVGILPIIYHFFEVFIRFIFLFSKGTSHVIPHLTPSATSPNFLRVGYALGGGLFLLHMLYGIHSVISR